MASIKYESLRSKMNQFIERLSVVSFASSGKKKKRKHFQVQNALSHRRESVNSPDMNISLQESVIADLCRIAFVVAEVSRRGECLLAEGPGQLTLIPDPRCAHRKALMWYTYTS